MEGREITREDILRARRDVRIIASDLDGSLLNGEKKVPRELFELAPRLKSMGIEFVAASGRSLVTLRNNFEPIKEEISYICDNGAVICADGKTLETRALTRELLELTLKTYEKMEDVCLLFCGQKGTYHLSVDYNRFGKHIDPYYINQIIVSDLHDIDDEIFKVAVCDLHRPGNYAMPIFSESLGERAKMAISGEVWMDIMARGVNKGAALEVLQKHFGASKEQTVAFGDYYNDIDLLERAEYSFVMQNANEDMKKYGKFIAQPNTENGVVKAIKKLLDL